MSHLTFHTIAARARQAGYWSRSNRFMVEVNLPATLRGVVTSTDVDSVNFNAKSASLPGRNLSTEEIRYSGNLARKQGVDFTFDDLSINCYLSESLVEKHIFEAWHSTIFDPAYQIGNYPDEYYGEIRVLKFSSGQSGQITGTYHFINAFPVNVGSVEQDFDSSGQLDILPVTFAYQRYYFSG